MAIRQRRPRRRFGHVVMKKKRWYADYIGPDGKRHTPGHSFATEREADVWLNKEEDLIELDRRKLQAWIPPEQRKDREQRNSVTVGQWLEQYHAGLSVRASTLQTYSRTINNRILDPIEPGDVNPAITNLKDIPLVNLAKVDVYAWWDGINEAYDTPETNR